MPDKNLHFIQMIQVQIINFSKDFCVQEDPHVQSVTPLLFLVLDAESRDILSLSLFTSHRSTRLCPVGYPLHIVLHIWFKTSPHRGLLSYHLTLWQCICHLLKYHSSIRMKTLWTASEYTIRNIIIRVLLGFQGVSSSKQYFWWSGMINLCNILKVMNVIPFPMDSTWLALKL